MLGKTDLSPGARAKSFADHLGIGVPILLAPMAGACPPSLSIAVANAGGLGACGALLMSPHEIHAWNSEFRANSKGAFQINLWIPGPPPNRDAELESQQREFLATWGPLVPLEAGDTSLPDFEAQCQAMLGNGAEGDLVDHGTVPAAVRRRIKGTRNPLVCHGHNGGGSEGGRRILIAVADRLGT